MGCLNQDQKDPAMNKIRLLAFTLIELLVVMAIIGTLAGILMPAIQKAVVNGKQLNAMNNAHQIGMALRMYSNDNDGNYPSGTNSYGQQIVTSNDAFRSLIPTYLDTEKVFPLAGSKIAPSADNDIQDAAHILQSGENYWSFISGLNSTSNSNWPLIVDSTDGTGNYSTQEGAVGGMWKGLKAISINTDGSSHIVVLLGTGNTRYLPRFDDKTKNALAVSDYMGTTAQLLEPVQ
jgi:prepilin-type N-terminal cleavage/methylation domain-containing protein